MIYAGRFRLSVLAAMVSAVLFAGGCNDKDASGSQVAAKTQETAAAQAAPAADAAKSAAAPAASGSSAAAPSATAQTASASAADASGISDKSSFQEKAAYSIGASVGSYLKAMRQDQEALVGELKLELIEKGFVDALHDKSQLENKEIENTLRELDRKAAEVMAEKAKQEAAANLEAGKKFLAENKVKDGVVTTDSGLQYKIITKGEGESPKPGDFISVTYKGTTIDGKVFDEQKEPVEFPLDGMIKGWVEALQLMQTGSEFELYVPADLAYGENGAGEVIKPNSVLIFNVKLTAVRHPDPAPAAEADAAKGTDTVSAADAEKGNSKDAAAGSAADEGKDQQKSGSQSAEPDPAQQKLGGH